MENFKKTYNLYEINAQYLIENSFISDKSDKRNKIQISYLCDLSHGLPEFDSYSSLKKEKICPLFDQLRMCRDVDYKPSCAVDNPDALLKDIVFVNFSSLNLSEKIKDKDLALFNASRFDSRIREEAFYDSPLLTKLYVLFTYGFKIRFSKDEIITYLPFDRSSSMTRNSRLTFINAELFDTAEKRVMLDMDFAKSKTKLKLSKYYAYRGLNLSDGDRADLIAPYLNEKSIIVINDTSRYYNAPLKVYTNSKQKSKDELIYADVINEDEHYVKNIFDGEGLISPKLSHLLSRELYENEDATSFQFRLPFAKGVLHSVDFHGIIKEYFCSAADFDELEIEDVFGIRRKIADAEIILTASQFKCLSWLKDYYDAQYEDPMANYFKGVNKYNHGLYVVRTNLSFNKQNTKFTYQYFNTLNIAPKEFKKLVEDGTQRLLKESYDLSVPVEAEQFNEFIDSSSFRWNSLVKKNPLIIKQARIKNDYITHRRSRFFDVVEGKVPVSGYTRFFSRDLLSLVLHIVENLTFNNSYVVDADIQNAVSKKEITVDDIPEDKISDRNFALLNSSQLSFTRFYAPGTNNLNPKFYYAIYRSPHLSRNETCALKAFVPYIFKTLIDSKGKRVKVNIYKKYFSHLNGVLMIANDSVVALTLGGADFDGDIVLLVTDERINKAVLSGAYEKDSETADNYRRVLPIIDINGGEETTSTLYTNKAGFIKNIYIKYFIDSTGDKTGIISNAAITIAEAQYSGFDYSSIENEAARINAEETLKICGENPAAFSSILTGLEIDAVKTGIHPSKNIKRFTDLSKILINVNRGIATSKDYYIEIKDLFDGIDKIRGNIKETETKYKYEYLNYAVSINKFDESAANIDNLPAVFAANYNSAKTSIKVNGIAESGLFDFEDDVKLYKDKCALIMPYINAYEYYRKEAGDRLKTDAELCKKSVFDLIKLKYDNINAFLHGCATTTSNAFSLLFDELNALSSEELSAMIDRMGKSSWQFLGNDKEEALKTLKYIFGDFTPASLNEHQLKSLFCDFRFSGYKILYYYLFFAKLQHYVCYIDPCGYKTADKNGADFYNELCSIYNENVKSGRSLKELTNTALRNAVLRHFSKNGKPDIHGAMCVLWTLDSKMRNKYFWDVFSNDELMLHIIDNHAEN